MVYHGGGIFGFPAFVAFFPDDGLGVAVMANGSTISPYYPHQEVVQWVAQRMLDLPPRDVHSETLAAIAGIQAMYEDAIEKRKAEADASVPPTLAAKAYSGEYVSGAEGASLGRAYVELKGDTLFFRLAEPESFPEN